ncbi:AAA family ATPase [Sinisalibacter lacisalsi]|uniref:Primase C-terminal 2 domain-containing protein n=1 Tax=Sinisalibacter lacisalsi TaxID=1526570 RepID=A0ABQ1QTW3_9RHOB|nr:AAA family ATPase [Sinisalibacter lacisalsi]GGD44715.1 hypothetical protein GCM10011358_30600 [Sinisalibacter lacisalsi]
MKIDTISATTAQADTTDNTAVAEWRHLLDEIQRAGLVWSEDRERVLRFQAEYACGLLGADTAQAAIADLLSGGHAARQALEAIDPLFQPGDVVEIRALDPAGGGARSHNGDLSVPDDRADLAEFIKTHNGRRNLYFGVNPRASALGGTDRAARDKDVAARRAVFLDMDRKDAPDMDPDWTRTRQELEALGPLLVVETGNGFHVHFRIEDQIGEDLSASVASLASAMARIGSDNVADLPRIARLPFTVNLPTKVKRQRGNTVALALPVPGTGALPLVEGAPRALEALCAEIEGVAQRLGLPGKRGRGDNSASASSNGTGEKRGDPAPSTDLLRMALQELPNDPGGPFDHYDDWIRIGHAIKGAAVAGGFEAEGRAAWVEWSAKWGGDPGEAESKWDSFKPHTGWGTLMRELERANPDGWQKVRDAMARAAFPPLPASFRLQPVQPFNATSLPPRPWLYGRNVIAGYISMLVAPGGTGKSALVMTEAVAMATGRTLLPGDNPHHPLRVHYHNAEDDRIELQRRFEAVMRHHGITHTDLGNRLGMTSGRELDLILARQGRDGLTVNRKAVEWLVEKLTQARIDVLILDPLGAMHTLPENSNEAANMLMAALREVAHKSGAAIVLVHHTGKMAAKDMDTAGAGAARGASAFVDGARVVRQLRPAGGSDVGSLGIASVDRRFYIRVDNGKANLAPAEEARWLRLVSVNLGNGTSDYPNGDDVQTVERWTPPVAAGASASDLAAVQAAIQTAIDAGEPPRAASSAREWVGYLIAETLGLPVGSLGSKVADLSAEERANLARIKAMVRGWLKDGSLEQYDAPDKNRQPRPCIRPGTPAIFQNGEHQDEQPGAA